MSNPQHPFAHLAPDRRNLPAPEWPDQTAQDRDHIPPLSRASDARFPLSSAQQRLWFLDQLQRNSPIYTMPFAIRLRGSLDYAALQQSLSAIVARHEVLRTTFAYDPSLEAPEPWQQIAPPGPVPLPLIILDPSNGEQAIRQAVQDLVAQPFDLSSGPLFRAALIRQSQIEYILVMSIHHSIFDGWSQNVLLREMSKLYADFTQNVPAILPPLPIQYADYAAWQRALMQGEVVEKQLGYWRQQLHGVQPLDLPTDRPRPSVRSSQGGQRKIQIAANQTAALRHLSQRLDCTLFMTLLAAWQVLLYRYTGQVNFAVGTPIAGRVQPELEDLIGFFVNTLVLRADLSGTPSFHEIAARTRSVCLNAYAHQDLPFDLLVEQIQPERDPSRSPLFQVMFVLQNTPRRAIDLPGLTIEPFGVETTTAKFDLSLALNEAGDTLHGSIEYSSDLFEAATIERLAGHYQTLLTAIITDPDMSIDDLPLLNNLERHRILTAWNATARSYPRDTCLHQLVEAQAARTPDAIAVVGRQQLTYAELNTRANQLAHELRRRGVEPETRVGICMEPAIDLIAGLLAILKAGGAYVPLDPSYPQERLAFLIEDSQVGIVLTQQQFQQSLARLVPTTICLDTIWSQIADLPATNPQPIASSANLAYIMYTSGSTGAPKGVLVPHRGIVNNLLWRQATWSLSADDRMLQNFSISFDPSVASIFWPLIAGARLVLAGPSEHADSAGLVRLLARHEITVYGATPTLHAALLEEPEITTCTSLRLVFSGGEPLAAEIQRRYFERLNVAMVNAYGPTETTIEATYWICSRDDTAKAAPIGRPIPNAQVYLLDARLQPVPIGAAGEIYIGGDGVARGYHLRPDLTAERFIPHPFTIQPGARLYKTGDLGRFRSDGTIEFLGRMDHQVKLRGARIELGEIEAALRQHEAVQDAVVILRNERLVAYVVEEPRTKNQEPGEQNGHLLPPSPAAAKPEARLSAGKGVLRSGGGEGLRQFLSSRLPSYMIPAAFVQLDALPLMPSGKLDRQALLSFEEDQTEAERAYVPPHGALEAQLARIWETVLQRHPVGATDNFFERGGHSLLAVRLVAQIEKQLGQRLSLTTIFAHPTVRELATALNERGWPGVLRKVDDLPEVRSPLVAIQPGGSKPPFFFVTPLGGVLPSNILSGILDLMPFFGPDQPYYGVQLPGLAHELAPYLDSSHLLDPAKLQALAQQFRPDAQRITEAAAQCIAAIRSVQPDGPYLLGGFCTGSTIAFEIACQLHTQGSTVSLLALVDPPLSLRRNTPSPATHASAAIQSSDIAAFLARLQQPDPDQVAWFVNRDLGGSRLAVDLADMAARLRELDGDSWWSYAAEQLAQAENAAHAVDPQELRRLFTIYQINTLSLNAVLARYEPPVYEGRMTIVQAEQMYAQTDNMAAHWQQLTTQPVEVRVVPGDHGTIFHEPNVQVLAQTLLDCIERAVAAPSLTPY